MNWQKVLTSSDYDLSNHWQWAFERALKIRTHVLQEIKSKQQRQQPSLQRHQKLVQHSQTILTVPCCCSQCPFHHFKAHCHQSHEKPLPMTNQSNSIEHKMNKLADTSTTWPIPTSHCQSQHHHHTCLPPTWRRYIKCCVFILCTRCTYFFMHLNSLT